MWRVSYKSAVVQSPIAHVPRTYCEYSPQRGWAPFCAPAQPSCSSSWAGGPSCLWVAPGQRVVGSVAVELPEPHEEGIWGRKGVIARQQPNGGGVQGGVC